MALRGIKVLEISGLAPGPFCGMILADYGASVIRIDKTGYFPEVDCLANGKKSVAINLKHPEGIGILRKMCKNSDVLIEPFRKGVMEKLGLGPKVLLEDNNRLIYARLTGYGQSGCLSERAGHDINYIAISGILSLLVNRNREPPVPPVNLLADFGGGGLMCALGIMAALYERHTSGKGQVIDCNMVEGSAYLGSWLTRGQYLPIWGRRTGNNILDGGAHFYCTYETKDNQWMAVGAIEPQFYEKFLEGLGVTEEQVPQFSEDTDSCRKIIAGKFKEKTREEWCKIFDGVDACVTPVLSLKEAKLHPHNVHQNTFITSADGEIAPKPAPNLSRTPANTLAAKPSPTTGQHTMEELINLCYTPEEIKRFIESGVISCGDRNKSKL